MELESYLTTARLLLKPLTLTDDSFIFELVNTEGWLRFIGNRNIASPVEARAYIQRILESKTASYWVVHLKHNEAKTGVVTYLKRDYLEHHDLGFAFLPRFCKKGYAFEAATAILDQLVQEQSRSPVLATTLPENRNSIMLLQRMGFVFEKEIEVEKEILHVYSASHGKLGQNST